VIRAGHAAKPRRSKWPARAVDLALLLAASVWIVPYAFMLSTSLKSLPELLRAPTAPLPASPTLAAYGAVFDSMPVGHYLWNTVVMAVAIAVIQIAVALPAAYALAKLDFRGRNLLLGVVVATLLVPAEVRFVPIFVGFAELGLINTMAALIVPFGVSAFGTFLLRQALLSVPDSLIEAARLDGASELRIVYGLLPPVLLPSLSAFFLFSFVAHWNDYFWPLVMTTDEAVRTLPLGVALLREQGTGMRWHVVMAGNVVLSAPMLALFVVAQRHLIRAVAGGRHL
jgi:sn-glycerol 3-phosphate transport system permease protein